MRANNRSYASLGRVASSTSGTSADCPAAFAAPGCRGSLVFDFLDLLLTCRIDLGRVSLHSDLLPFL